MKFHYCLKELFSRKLNPLKNKWKENGKRSHKIEEEEKPRE